MNLLFDFSQACQSFHINEFIAEHNAFLDFFPSFYLETRHL